MREYGKIFSQFWTDPDIDKLSPRAKLCGVYLQSNKHGNLLGCYYLPVAYIACDLAWNHQDVKRELRTLENAGFCLFDYRHEFVLIQQFLKFNRLANWNEGKALAKEFARVPVSSSVRDPLAAAILEYCPRFLPEQFVDDLKTQKAVRG